MKNSSEIEAVIFDLVSKLLAIPEVRAEDNFFDLGGNSIFATVLAEQVEQELGVALPIKVLFEVSTIGQLSAAISVIASSSGNWGPDSEVLEEGEI